MGTRAVMWRWRNKRRLHRDPVAAREAQPLLLLWPRPRVAEKNRSKPSERGPDLSQPRGEASRPTRTDGPMPGAMSDSTDHITDRSYCS